MDYRQSGVNIDAGNETVRRIKSMARSTFTAGVLSEIGSFGGLFRLADAGVRDPVLVASADGVGTKLKVAFMTGRHNTVGADLVNHCVNDILVQGARPLFFLDYLATGVLSPDVAEQVIHGVTRACRENGCALLGGETAEMPGFYADGEYDIAGFIVGVVDRSRLIDGKTIEPGDSLIALPSSGLHTNGYSLARRVFFGECGMNADTHVPELGTTIGGALLAEHRSYLNAVSPLLDGGLVKGMAHITGGGITENLPRCLPDGCDAYVDLSSWEPPAIFRLLQERGGIDRGEMLRAFNMGVGLILAVRVSDSDAVVAALERAGEHPIRLGDVRRGSRLVQYRRVERVNRRIAVLISGRGSNLQALIDAIREGRLDATIEVVISNRRDADGLQRATEAGIPTVVMSPREYPTRNAYDQAIVAALRSHRVALVCLAGFMRLIGAPLLDVFPGRILNVHPSLLPAFPGLEAQRQAFEHGARVSGATVHLVTAGLDEGPIVLQSAVPVLPDDSIETLSARILVEEHRIYPKAVQIVLDGKWRLDGRRFVIPAS